MSARYPPLNYRDVVTILRNLGFTPRPGSGTSHEQWVRENPPPFRKVTVDRPKSPFTGDLVAYMARQAGITKKEFYQALRG